MNSPNAIPDDLDAYNDYIESMRKIEYPMLNGATYLDHAGTTLYSKSLMERFHQDMMSNLYGNPHSASPSSQRSTQLVESVRLELLRFFRADPEDFDLVFTANSTAGMKLVGEAFREFDVGGFTYGYHVDSHTSLVGLRGLASSHQCLESDDEVDRWLVEIVSSSKDPRPALLAYPLQSNLNGRRLPMAWCREVEDCASSRSIYTLLDAAAYVSTSSLDLSNVIQSPDFTVLSLYKIFGFPDLGALIVKKRAAHVFSKRQYFAGGTVDMVSCLKEEWHAMKLGALHERLEDGTLPMHSILALKSAMRTHRDLFGILDNISRHTADLAKRLYDNLAALKHANGRSVCTVYKHPGSHYGDSTSQGPILAFNLLDAKGQWVSNAEVEKLAAIENIHLRTGGVCNPGGVATALNLSSWEMRENLSSGHRCGGENDIWNGKPTGVIRLSMGPMSARSDVQRFTEFIEEFFVDETTTPERSTSPVLDVASRRFHVESLTVYPIKSCGGWQVPYPQAWEVRAEGLAWDREWCIVHQGTGKALSQKQCPRMALLRPTLDLKEGKLHVALVGSADNIDILLSKNPNHYISSLRECKASVCEDDIRALVYTSPAIAEFFTRAIGIPCTLARFNPASDVSRHSKLHLQASPRACPPRTARPILLSNESPILTISRSSLNRLNEQIKATGGKAALPSVFRPNIVLAESPLLTPGQEQPWAEDHWQSMRIGAADGPSFEFLGGCRRCQMVCVDQESAEKNAQPFVTLAKTRRFDGRVLFGVHTALADASARYTSIKAGDAVETF